MSLVKIEKRDFIKGTIGLSIMLTIPSVDLAREQRYLLENVTTYLVFDQHYKEAKEFAETFIEQGAVLHEIGMDAGQLWHGVLRKNIRDSIGNNSGQIIGMTTASDLLVIESFAKEFNLKLKYKEIRVTQDSRAKLLEWMLS